MIHRQTSWTGALLCSCLLPLTIGCTDSNLYQGVAPPMQPDKLTISGTVCTDDPLRADLPKKVLFMIDMSASLRAGKNDPGGKRGAAIEEVVNLWGQDPNFHFGVIAFADKAKNLLTDATGARPVGFSRDKQKLLAATSQLRGGSIAGLGNRRNLRAALSLANSIVSGDVLAADPGEVTRSTYLLVLFSGGPPVPAVGRCACRDESAEKTDGSPCVSGADCASGRCVQGACMNTWEGCPWRECDCKVTCDLTVSRCSKDGGACEPVCSPPCQSGSYCSAAYVCVQGTPTFPPTVPPLLPLPPSLPDTFSLRVPPPKTPGACNTLTCVYPAGGYAGSCEERLLVKDVLELKAFAANNSAGGLQLHTTYLPDAETRASSDPFYPPPAAPQLAGCSGDAAADRARAARLLSQLAYAGGGDFQRVDSADKIAAAFVEVGRKALEGQDALVVKELVVHNENVIADGRGLHPDTDADGLADAVERTLGTCLSDEDSDGDGVGDAVEVLQAGDPTRAEQPVECKALPHTTEQGADPCDAAATPRQRSWTRYADRDGDRLNACEERLLGTDDSLFDSDADGIPDRIEVLAGTNFLAADPLKDPDLDGVVNRVEVRGHTDPRSNDVQSALDRAYRYEEVDEGLKEVVSVTQPQTITGVRVVSVSAASSTGAGELKFTPGGGGAPPTLAWRDYGDRQVGGAFGPAVDIARPSAAGYRLTSCRLVKGGGCTADSPSRYITVQVEGKASYPPKPAVELLQVSRARRNCLRFTVRNITLLQTGKHRLLGTRGNNTVVVYFAQAPAKAKDGPGIFRVASKRLVFDPGPPASRTPRDAVITFRDDEFKLDVTLRKN